MNNLKLKRFLLILFAISAVIWYLIAAVSDLNLARFADFIRPIPKVVSIDLLLVAAFARWGWRWKYLQGWLVPFPDLNGTWQGEIQTSWKDEHGHIPGPIPVILNIKQTFLRISCVMKTAEMESHSYSEGLCIDTDAQLRQLCYSYTSRTKTALRGRSTPHDGTILLSIIGEPVRKLQGEYWTQRQTTGTVTVIFRTKQLLDEPPADMPSHPMSAE